MTTITKAITRASAGAAAMAVLFTAGMTPAPAHAREKKAAEEAKGPKLTEAVRKQLLDAQTKIKAGDNAGAVVALKAAEQVPDRTPDDNFYIANLKIQAAQSLKDNALLREALEQAIASGKSTPEQTSQFVRVLANLAVQANDYPTAQKYYEQMAAATPDDPAVTGDLAKIYLRSKQTAKADAMLSRAIASTEAKGGKADEELYLLRVQIAYDSKNIANMLPTSLALVRAYPKPKNWDAAIYSFRNQKLDEQIDIDTYRLQRATGSMTGEGQWLDYAQTAQLRGLPAESRAVLSEAVSRKIVDTSKPAYQELSRGASPAKIAADRASLPASERQARAAANGKLANGTADGYFAHGDYAKAADLYRVALTKGGVDVARVNTRLGIALAQAGDKAGAEAAFKSVSGEPRATLAQYWLVWLGQKA